MIILSVLRQPPGRRQRWTELAKRALRQILPAPALLAVKRVYAWLMTRSARRAFESASVSPEWLSADKLDHLQTAYPCPPDYGYDATSLDKRGRDRAEVLTRLLTPHVTGRSILELGCADGMVCAALQRAGASTTAVDRSPDLFDERARRDGVRFLEADVTDLPFDDSQFDLVFSYNSFEHFASPDSVFREAIRVANVGGLIYVHFGPLYQSAFGLHADRSITVPYCHYLFPRYELDRYVEAHGLGPIPHNSLNEWSLPRYRELWEDYSAHLNRVLYREIPEVHGTELIVRHPGCFRSKTEEFENLIIGTIEAAFRKKT